MTRVILVAACTGCCADTYEVVADRTAQPIAELAVDGATVTGVLVTAPRTVGFTTTLSPESSSEYYVLRVGSTTPGAFMTTLDVMNAGTVLRTFDVDIVTNVTLDKVCLADGQNDYGTGRCRDTYVGTIDITGAGVSGAWELHQLAVIIDGTPDC